MWIYGSCVLIPVADLEYTSTQECSLIAYQLGQYPTWLLSVCSGQKDWPKAQAHFSPRSPAFTSTLIILLRWEKLCLSSDETRWDCCKWRIQRVSVSSCFSSGTEHPICHAYTHGLPSPPFTWYYRSTKDCLLTSDNTPLSQLHTDESNDAKVLGITSANSRGIGGL